MSVGYVDPDTVIAHEVPSYGDCGDKIGFLSANVAQVRFMKSLRQAKQEPVTQPFVATVEFAFEPKTERSLAHVWENPLGFTVSAYRVDPETLETTP